MRNLVLFRNFVIRDATLSNSHRCDIFTEPSSWKTTYFSIATDLGEVYIFDTDCDKIFSTLCRLDLKQISYIEWLASTSIVGIQHVFNSLYVTLNSGVFIILPLPCTSVDEGNAFDSEVRNVKQVSWSGDCERTILMTGSSSLTLLFVTNDECEKIIDISLQDASEEKNKFINVGWGSTETQFRGSEGKLSKRNQEIPDIAESTNDAVVITWKKNSSAFAVSYKCHYEGRRKVKIFNQNGILLNVTKDVIGLEAVMDWSPSRNLISNLQTLPNKKVVCFLEENGLRHGDFQIPSNHQMEKLVWNYEGTILATLGKEPDNQAHIVLLWTTSNYKWYIKQRLEFKMRVLHLQWDDSKQNRLHFILEGGIYRMYEWLFDIIESDEYTNQKYMSRIVVNVDGSCVNFSPYGRIFRPPSLSESVRSFSCDVNEVIFAKNSSLPADEATSALIYSSKGTLLRCNFSEDNSTNMISVEKTYQIVLQGRENSSIRFTTAAEFSVWTWMAERNELYFCWTNIEGYYFCMSTLNSESNQCIIRHMMKVESRILLITRHKSRLIVHLENGAILVYNNGVLRASKIILPEPCRRIIMLNNATMIALSENRNLYVNQNIKWRGISSLHWRHPFLVAITSTNRLMIAKLDENDLVEISNRRIEPKSHLASVVGDQVLLEMDRGNVELITPRPFVAVKMAVELLNERYYEVFKLLRKQRVNLNVIFDHDSDMFFRKSQSIVESVLGDTFYLTLFIMELENENVAYRMFPWKYDKDCKFDVNRKVQLVCEHLFQVMEKFNEFRLILPMISALVRLDRLAEAAKYAVDYDEVFFLFQLVDSRRVYEAVMASYDLGYALKIAEFSKIDPSDYLPLIKKLQKMDENYRKFSINDYLKNYPEALKYLSFCQEESYFEELVKYMEKHHLQSRAFKLYSEKLNSKDDSDVGMIEIRFIRITAIFADFLFKAADYENAAILYEKAGMHDKALECYSSCGNWHSAISLMKSLHFSEFDSKNWYEKLHNVLVSKRRYEEAGFLALVFMKNPLISMKNYLIARCYEKAVDAARTLGTLTMASVSLKPKLVEDAETYVKEFSKLRQTLKSHCERFEQLKNEDNQDAELKFNGNESYTSSDSSSTCSTTTSMRSVTSSLKRLRRRERKLWNLKPGNPREKPSLINAIRVLVCDCEKNFYHRVCDLVTALIKINEYDTARNLHSEYCDFCKFISITVKKIWNDDEVKEDGGFKDLEIKFPPSFNLYSSDVFSHFL